MYRSSGVRAASIAPCTILQVVVGSEVEDVTGTVHVSRMPGLYQVGAWVTAAGDNAKRLYGCRQVHYASGRSNRIYLTCRTGMTASTAGKQWHTIVWIPPGSLSVPSIEQGLTCRVRKETHIPHQAAEGRSA